MKHASRRQSGHRSGPVIIAFDGSPPCCAPCRNPPSFTIGRAVVLTATAYMLSASLAMGVADPLGLWRPRGGSVFGTIGSSVPAVVALIATAA